MQRKRSYDISSYHWHFHTAECYNNYYVFHSNIQSVISTIVRKIVSNVCCVMSAICNQRLFICFLFVRLVECISICVYCYARVLYCIRYTCTENIRVWRHSNVFNAWQITTFIRNVCFVYFHSRHTETASWPLLTISFFHPLSLGFSFLRTRKFCEGKIGIVKLFDEFVCMYRVFRLAALVNFAQILCYHNFVYLNANYGKVLSMNLCILFIFNEFIPFHFSPVLNGDGEWNNTVDFIPHIRL